MSSDLAHANRLPAVHTRIRRRRSERGLTGTELAQRAGISASYVSVIENGARVPDEEVAALIARALDDDETLYRAWARASRLGPNDAALLRELEAISRTPAFASLVESGGELPRREPSAPPEEPDVPVDLATRLREVAYRLGPEALAARGARAATSAAPSRAATAAEVVGVPVLAEGADPAAARGTDSPLADDHLYLDRRLLRGHEPRQLFAYELTARSTRHLRGVADPGDRVVLRQGGAVASGRICAVRTPRGIVLSRAIVSDRSLILLPGEGEVAFEAVELTRPGQVTGVVAGTQVLLIRG
jgi:transcriptional regulator with XRE-family HTH domain